MANHDSSKKRIKQTIVRTERNKHVRSTVRSFVKTARLAIESGDKAAASTALADAIRWVLTNADERERKAAAAQEYAINRFSIARTADAVYSAWDGVLNSR